MKNKKPYNPYPGGLCKLKRQCHYGCYGASKGQPDTCDYFMITGKQRPCPADECTVFRPQTVEERRIEKGRKWVGGHECL